VNILGFSAWFHDSAACLLQDGQLVAMAEEERFSRRKHTPEFPRQSIAYCLETAGLSLDDVDAVVYYLDPPSMLFENCNYVVSQLPAAPLVPAGTTVVPVQAAVLRISSHQFESCAGSSGPQDGSARTLPHYRHESGRVPLVLRSK